MAPSMLGHGRCWMKRLQRYQKRRSFGGSWRCGTSWRSELEKKLRAKNRTASSRPPRNRPLWPVTAPRKTPTTPMPTAISAARDVLSIRVPTQPSSAGSSVSEATTMSSTPSAEAMATPWTKLSPMSIRPSSEMITVVPGEQHGSAARVERLDDGLLHAEPELQPFAVAGDDEQRVVDADTEADHGDHRRREVRHRDHVADQRHEGEGDADAEQGDADRQPHRQDRSEGDDEDDDGGDDAVDLALRQLELAEQVAAVLDLDALDGGEAFGELLDVLAERGDLLEAAVARPPVGRSRSCRRH